MVFAAHQLFGTACITALTVQSTQGVRSSHPTSHNVLRDTLHCLVDDMMPSGIKIGVLSTIDNLSVICDYLDLHQELHWHSAEGWIPVVVDPVLSSSSGTQLLEPASITLMRDRLLPQVDWITPNLHELAVLSGIACTARDDLPRACRALQTRTAISPDGHRLGIFATGGHLDPPDDYLLLPTGQGLWLPGVRVPTRATHGTGCALSSAFLSRLVLGDTPREAAHTAKLYVAQALQSASPIGSGNGPMNLLWPILNH